MEKKIKIIVLNKNGFKKSFVCFCVASEYLLGVNFLKGTEVYIKLIFLKFARGGS